MQKIVDDMTDRLPEGFKMNELMSRDSSQNRSPYEVVCLQECERMNELIGEIKRSLKELILGLKVKLLFYFLTFGKFSKSLNL